MLAQAQTTLERGELMTTVDGVGNGIMYLEYLKVKASNVVQGMCVCFLV